MAYSRGSSGFLDAREFASKEEGVLSGSRVRMSLGDDEQTPNGPGEIPFGRGCHGNERDRECNDDESKKAAHAVPRDARGRERQIGPIPSVVTDRYDRGHTELKRSA